MRGIVLRMKLCFLKLRFSANPVDLQRVTTVRCNRLAVSKQLLVSLNVIETAAKLDSLVHLTLPVTMRHLRSCYDFEY